MCLTHEFANTIKQYNERRKRIENDSFLFKGERIEYKKTEECYGGFSYMKNNCSIFSKMTNGKELDVEAF